MIIVMIDSHVNMMNKKDSESFLPGDTFPTRRLLNLRFHQNKNSSICAQNASNLSQLLITMPLLDITVSGRRNEM